MIHRHWKRMFEDSVEELNSMDKAEGEVVSLVHYSKRDDLKTIDPKHYGKGVDAGVKGRDTWHPHSFFF